MSEIVKKDKQRKYLLVIDLNVSDNYLNIWLFFRK